MKIHWSLEEQSLMMRSTKTVCVAVLSKGQQFNQVFSQNHKKLISKYDKVFIESQPCKAHQNLLLMCTDYEDADSDQIKLRFLSIIFNSLSNLFFCAMCLQCERCWLLSSIGAVAAEELNPRLPRPSSGHLKAVRMSFSQEFKNVCLQMFIFTYLSHG
jgi:hypothetical protein